MNDHNEELQPPIVRPNPLNFGTSQQGGSLTRQEWIGNPNEQQLLWCADNGGTSWLTLEPSAGTLEADKQEPINVTANTSSLAVGDHAATLTFTWEGDDYSVSTPVPVTLAISSVSPLAVGLSFSLSPKSSMTLPLAITNRYDRTVGWTANTGGTRWLTLDRSKGILQAREQQTIYLTVNASSLVSGDYPASLTFTPEVEDTKLEGVQFPVELHVHFTPFGDNGPKAPIVRPNHLDFGATNNRLQLQFVNPTNQIETGQVDWTLNTGGVSWLNLESNAGILQRGKSQKVNVMVDRSTLPAAVGPYTTNLLLTFTFHPAILGREPTSIPIPVTMTVP
jgi:Viral BACON domain